MTVLPLLANFLSNFTIYIALKLSRPDVGSSSKIRLGFVISSTPIAVLFLSPPEIVFYKTLPITVFWTFFKPKSLMRVSILSYLSSSVKLDSFKFAANVRASLGVKC